MPADRTPPAAKPRRVESSDPRRNALMAVVALGVGGCLVWWMGGGLQPDPVVSSVGMTPARDLDGTAGVRFGAALETVPAAAARGRTPARSGENPREISSVAHQARALPASANTGRTLVAINELIDDIRPECHDLASAPGGGSMRVNFQLVLQQGKGTHVEDVQLDPESTYRDAAVFECMRQGLLSTSHDEADVDTSLSVTLPVAFPALDDAPRR